MITCLGLTYLSTGPSTKSVMEDVPLTTTEVPLLPDAKPVQPGAEPAAPPTTATPEAQEFSIVSSAATPPNDAP